MFLILNATEISDITSTSRTVTGRYSSISKELFSDKGRFNNSRPEKLLFRCLGLTLSLD